MFEWTTAAVEAWSALVTAIAAAVGVPFLLWDRFRAKPHQVSGYLMLADDGLLSVYVYSELGERLILTSLDAYPYFALAKQDPRTPAQKHIGKKHVTWWMTRLPMRRVAAAGHAGNDPITKVQIRTSKDDGLKARIWRELTVPTIVARGVLPYRARGGRFRVELTLPETNLRDAVLRIERKRMEVS